jgi:peptide/nickel transport system permease protein
MIGLRLLASIPLLIVCTGLVFFLEGLIPGNAASSLLGPLATPQAIHNLEVQLGLNQSVWVQYWHWLDSALHGNLGNSYTTRQPVTAILNPRVPVTLSLVFCSTFVATIIGVSLGIFSAVRGRRMGKVVDVLSVVGLVLPSFWLAIVLVFIFSVDLHVLPAIGYTSFLVSPFGWARTLILPVAALSIGQMTLIAKQTRDQMIEVLNSKFILSLRANGVTERSIVFRHALRNAAIPVVTVIGATGIGALGAVIFVETIFAQPGLGAELVSAANNFDIPTILGLAVYFTLIVIVINLLVDISYAALNPRARSSR